MNCQSNKQQQINKKRMKRGNGRFNARADQSQIVNIDLQMNLLNTWVKYKVSDYYQNVFLAFLDELAIDRAEKEIKNQIKHTIEKNTYFFAIGQLEQQRRTQILALREALSSTGDPIAPQALPLICEQVQKLRGINLELAQTLIKMYQRFKCYNPESTSKQIPYFQPFFERLNKENDFIKTSILRDYLQFDDGYDPFLMDHYERIHKNAEAATEQSIKALFNLNISYVYRLLKAKNNILEIRAMGKGKEVEQSIMIDRSERRQRKYSMKKGREIARGDDEASIYGAKAISTPSKRFHSEQSMPIKIAPIKVLPTRTTIYSPSRSRSPAYTQGNYEMVLSRMNPNQFSYYDNDNSVRNQRKGKIYLQTEPSEYHTPPYRLQKLKLNADDFSDQFYTEKLRPYKLTPITHQKEQDHDVQSIASNQFTDNLHHQTSKGQRMSQFNHEVIEQKAQEKQDQPYKPQKKKVKEFTNDGYEVKNYNPIKKDQFALIKKENKSSKYDFRPNQKENDDEASISYEEDTGLSIERPIYKYNKKNVYMNKVNTEPRNLIEELKLGKKTKIIDAIPVKNAERILPTIEKVNQQCQTLQNQNSSALKNQATTTRINKSGDSLPSPNTSTLKNQATVEKPRKQSNNFPSTSQKTTLNPNNSLSKNPLNQSIQKPRNAQSSFIASPKQTNFYDPDLTLQNEDIVDERPPQRKEENSSLIRTVPKQQRPISPPKIIETQPRKNSSQISSLGKISDKKQIKIKIGKSTITELLSLLQSAQIPPQYKNLFAFEKLFESLKINQAYLTQFHVNGQCAIVALCSPVPGIGIALKLWVPILPVIDFTLSNSLFQKYLEFIEKSTTAQKIMFNGNGQAFKQLKNSGFIMRKENLYERVRKIPPKIIQFEFKPFLYVECSTVNFIQNDNRNTLFSQQIEQFTPVNSFITPFLCNINQKTVPNGIQSLIKINENLKNFQEVNNILTAEQFDNYQAGDMKISSIHLLRFFINTPMKSNFIANDGHLQFIGTLLYEKGEKSLISLNTSKVNGVMYFSKGMLLKEMTEKCKIPSTNKVKFSVKMFHKVLYGKLPTESKGCYGNWEINLTWEDEMQGKVKHQLPQGRCFGPQPFLIGIQMEKELLYCAEIKKEDFIY